MRGYGAGLSSDGSSLAGVNSIEGSSHCFRSGIGNGAQNGSKQSLGDTNVLESFGSRMSGSCEGSGVRSSNQAFGNLSGRGGYDLHGGGSHDSYVFGGRGDADNGSIGPCGSSNASAGLLSMSSSFASTAGGAARASMNSSLGGCSSSASTATSPLSGVGSSQWHRDEVTRIQCRLKEIASAAQESADIAAAAMAGSAVASTPERSELAEAGGMQIDLSTTLHPSDLTTTPLMSSPSASSSTPWTTGAAAEGPRSPYSEKERCAALRVLRADAAARRRHIVWSGDAVEDNSSSSCLVGQGVSAVTVFDKGAGAAFDGAVTVQERCPSSPAATGRRQRSSVASTVGSPVKGRSGALTVRPQRAESVGVTPRWSRSMCGKHGGQASPGLDSDTLSLERRKSLKARSSGREWLKTALNVQVTALKKELLESSQLQASQSRREAVLEEQRLSISDSLQERHEAMERRFAHAAENRQELERFQRMERQEKAFREKLREERLEQRRALQQEEADSASLRAEERRREAYEESIRIEEERRQFVEAQNRAKDAKADMVARERGNLWGIRRSANADAAVTLEKVQEEIQRQRSSAQFDVGRVERMAQELLDWTHPPSEPWARTPSEVVRHGVGATAYRASGAPAGENVCQPRWV
eukprot:TRINITY_DN61880_c0_g1_i1.p1 TRINITY_DN61880_c0_g1~~TRINITY_DN61880_c0_g1_i1.p1  ORF type:complete len:645 (+),score=129.91 TRINITY_DN61880_c0_g1_i1:49-1983(+)